MSLNSFTEESKFRCGKNHNKTLEVEPEDVTGLLQYHDKTVMNGELLLMDEQIKWFLEIE